MYKGCGRVSRGRKGGNTIGYWHNRRNYERSGATEMGAPETVAQSKTGSIVGRKATLTDQKEEQGWLKGSGAVLSKAGAWTRAGVMSDLSLDGKLGAWEKGHP